MAGVVRRTIAIGLLVALAITAGVLATRATFLSQRTPINIGAHEATLAPTLDGFVVINAGPLLPQFRLSADAPLGIGVRIDLGDSDAADLDEVVTRDAVIASQPEGEINRVRSVVTSMWWRAAMRGGGVALLVVVVGIAAWWAVGRRRRDEIVQRLAEQQRRTTLGVGVLTAFSLVAVALVAAPQPTDRAEPAAWEPLRSVFPEVPADPLLDQLEVSQGSATTSGKSLVDGAIRTYRESEKFYRTLSQTAADVTGIREPLPDETTAVVVTDRHDNVAMDPVVRELADLADASMVFDLGDDTSNGASWEEFSINSLARIFRGMTIVAVAGNHDTGATVKDTMVERGFDLLDGSIREIDGIRFIGDSDPRSSGLTKGYTGNESDNIDAVKEQDAALTEVACDADQQVAVALVHSAASAKKLARSGCVRLILSGHLHRQVGPKVIDGENGLPVTTLTTGSTGGAIYAFALGTGLRRDAQTTIITFRDGIPVGLQVITIEPGGEITPGTYVALPEAPTGDASPTPSASATPTSDDE